MGTRPVARYEAREKFDGGWAAILRVDFGRGGEILVSGVGETEQKAEDDLREKLRPIGLFTAGVR